MGRLSASLLVVSLAALASVGLAACGGGGAELLPGKTATEIESNLDKVAQLADEGECVGAADAAQEVSSEVEALSGVDRKLKQALTEGTARLNEVVSGCEEAEEPAEEEFESEEPEEEVENTGRSERHERAEERAQKAEKEAAETGESEAKKKGPKSPPNGEAKGNEGGETGGGEEGGGQTEAGGGSESPSGGVGPAVPAGGE